MDTKTCNSCNLRKEIDSFHFSNAKTEQRKSKCKDCQAKYFQEYKARNSESLRAKWRDASKKYHTYDNRRAKTLKKYNLTAEDYESLCQLQEYKCKICRREITLVIDHDHKTLKVRGLLCNACNLAIGYLEDNVSRLESAISYLEHSGVEERPSSQPS